MTVTKKQAQAALNSVHCTTQAADILRAVIDAMPDDPESREERLGRVCREAFTYTLDVTDVRWIAAAAAVEAECPKPREVTDSWFRQRMSLELTPAEIARINRYVRGEDA